MTVVGGDGPLQLGRVNSFDGEFCTMNWLAAVDIVDVCIVQDAALDALNSYITSIAAV